MPDATVNDDRPFRHYTLKHRVVAWISTRLFDRVTYTVGHGLLKGMKRKGGLGWMPERFSPGTPTAEQKFWASLNLQGKIAYDVGAFQGLITLLLASRAKKVVAFEPNTRNYKRLMENLALNHIENVEVRKVGVSSKHESRTMVGSPLMPGGSSLDDKVASELLRSGLGTVVEEITLVTLDEEIAAGLPAPDFIKVDIEGWELEALKGARNTLAVHKPALFLEMHGETLNEKKRKVAELVAFLWEMNYRGIRHIETGTEISPQNSSVAMQGHLHCLPT
jgi:FkbM family methyltransferase